MKFNLNVQQIYSTLKITGCLEKREGKSDILTAVKDDITLVDSGDLDSWYMKI